MHDEINFLKGAIDGSVAGSLMKCFLVRKDCIYAQNHRMAASVPFESDVEFNIPAEELCSALGRIKEVTELGYEDGALVIKGGRTRVRIRTVDEEATDPPFQADSSQWRPVPPGLSEILKACLPFTGDEGYLRGMCLQGNTITAARNTRLVRFTLEGLDVAEILLSRECAEFIIAQGDPLQFATTEHSIEFLWEDDRWMRASVMSGKFPASVERILGDLPADAPVIITDEWREVIADLEAISDGTIILFPTGIRGEKGASQIVSEFVTGATKERSYWTLKVLGPVIALADAFDPDASPKPSLFIGPNFRGCVVGVDRAHS